MHPFKSRGEIFDATTEAELLEQQRQFLLERRGRDDAIIAATAVRVGRRREDVDEKRTESALSEETIKTALAARDEEKDRRNEEEEEDNALRKKGCGTGEEEDRKAGRRNEPAGENVGGPFVVEEASLKIIERDTSNAIPTAPTAKGGSEKRGFPKAEHRSKEEGGNNTEDPKIMSKFARRRAEMRGEKILDVREPDASRRAGGRSAGDASASAAAASTSTILPEHEDKDVAAETKRVLESMSVEDALKQKKELEEKMDPKMVAFFRNRNLNRNRNNKNNMNMNNIEDKG